MAVSLSFTFSYLNKLFESLEHIDVSHLYNLLFFGACDQLYSSDLIA